MRPYEIAVIFKTEAEEPAVQNVIDRVTSTIETSGGKAQKVNRWGRRQFAYEIDHKTDGNYVIIESQIDPAAVAETDRVLFLADEVVRHKIIRMPEGAHVRSSEGVHEKNPERPYDRKRERS